MPLQHLRRPSLCTVMLRKLANLTIVHAGGHRRRVRSLGPLPQRPTARRELVDAELVHRVEPDRVAPEAHRPSHPLDGPGPALLVVHRQKPCPQWLPRPKSRRPALLDVVRRVHDVLVHHAIERQLATDDGLAQVVEDVPVTWEKQVLSARGFKRVGRHSEYAI